MVRLIWDNLVDSATLTASSEDPAFPGINIANALRSKAWRTGTSTADEDIVIDHGSAKAITCVILLDHDLTAGDSDIVLEANATDSWGGPSFSQALTRVEGPIAAYFSSESYRYNRIAFTKSASGETRDIGRVFVGTYDSAPTTGHPIHPKDLSKKSQSDGGQTFSNIRPIYDQITLEMNVITKAIYDLIKTMFDTVGTHQSFFISIDHDVEPVDWIYYVKAKTIPSFQPISTTAYWRTSLSLDEQL